VKVDVRCEISGGAQLVDAVANESAISHEVVFTTRIASTNATESEQKTPAAIPVVPPALCWRYERLK
jgi:hypothetical protein